MIEESERNREITGIAAVIMNRYFDWQLLNPDAL
jgi:hypothetical protein